MVFSGSLVVGGRGIAVVTATGMKTEIGKIASMMNATEEKKTPLQVKPGSVRQPSGGSDYGDLPAGIRPEPVQENAGA